MHFAQIVRLLSLSADDQILFLDPIPENSGVRDYSVENNVFEMLNLYVRSFAPQDDAGFEGIENWLRRTQLPAEFIEDQRNPVRVACRHLFTALRMIEGSQRCFLFTAHGLRNADEWMLIRHLAEQVIMVAGWQRTELPLTFTTLKRNLDLPDSTE